MAHLRRRGPGARPLFLLTRSSAILDLAARRARRGDHPLSCQPQSAEPGRYEAVATCLASPEVRERTAGVVAWRPEAARRAVRLGRNLSGLR